MTARGILRTVGVLLIVGPPVAMLAVVMQSPIGSAPGLLMGFLFLPGAAVSLLGCAAVAATARRRGPALLIFPAAWVTYVAMTLPMFAYLWDWKEERFLRTHVPELREIAARILRQESTLDAERMALEKRGLSIRLRRVLGKPPDAVAFVLGSAIDTFYGIAFSTTGARPVLERWGRVTTWKRVPNEDYYWWRSD